MSYLGSCSHCLPATQRWYWHNLCRPRSRGVERPVFYFNIFPHVKGCKIKYRASRAWQVKMNPARSDNMIIQSICLLDQLDKDLNTFAMRVREWYCWHFPELRELVKDNYMFARCASFINVGSSGNGDQWSSTKRRRYVRLCFTCVHGRDRVDNPRQETTHEWSGRPLYAKGSRRSDGGCNTTPQFWLVWSCTKPWTWFDCLTLSQGSCWNY